MSTLLGDLLAELSAAPHSAAALTLYSLVCTLEFERAGYLFKLIKLRDLTPAQRQLAYRLIELMAEGRNQGVEWESAKLQMDALVRAG